MAASASIGEMENGDICGTCTKKFNLKDKSVACNACDSWYHIKCQNVSEDKFKVLSMPGNEDLLWFCSGCSKSASKFLKMFTALNERQDKLEDRQGQVEKAMTDLSKGMGEIKQELVELTKLATSTDTKVETIIEAKLADGLDQKMEERVNVRMKEVHEEIDEKLEMEKRKMNIIVHGLKETVNKDNEPEHDLEMVKELFGTGLKLDSVRHVSVVERIGKADNDKTRPLRIKLLQFESKAEIMKRAKDLKENDSFKKVVITPDLTRKQQIKDKELRTKLKEFRENGIQNCKISKGKIVKNERGRVETLFQV